MMTEFLETITDLDVAVGFGRDHVAAAAAPQVDRRVRHQGGSHCRGKFEAGRCSVLRGQG